MADLTDPDARVLKEFLLSSCDDISRWLPPPQWEPVWQSEAARECANLEHGPDGPWGENPVRTVFAGGAMYLHTILDCVTAIAATLNPDTTPYVTETLARAAMEAGSVLWWLLEPGIGVRVRVARFWLIRASGAERLAEAVGLTDPGGASGQYGETPAMVEGAIRGLGLAFTREQDRHTGRWSWTCEGEKLPGYTARATAFEAACGMTAAYSIYSGPAHAEWHAILSRYQEEVLPDGSRLMTTRPDRVAIAAAAIAAVGFAVRPADRALSLLGHKARLAEIPYHALHAKELMRRFELPAW